MRPITRRSNDVVAAAVRELPLIDELPHKHVNALILRIYRTDNQGVARVEI